MNMILMPTFQEPGENMNFKSLLAIALLSTACIPTTKDDTGSSASTEPAAEAAAEPSSEPSSPTSEPAADTTDCTGMPAEDCFQCFATENPTGAHTWPGHINLCRRCRSATAVARTPRKKNASHIGR